MTNAAPGGAVRPQVPCSASGNLGGTDRAARWPVNADVAVYVTIGLTALVLRWMSQARVSSLPFWAPWEFSFVEYLSGWLGLFWYLRGLARTPAA